MRTEITVEVEVGGDRKVRGEGGQHLKKGDIQYRRTFMKYGG